jgi:uncharacterized protein (TIGR00288 family)
MVLNAKNEDVVVFFDFENIVYSLRNSQGENPNFELLMDKCQEYGRIVLARAYADWSRHGTVIAPLQASGFDPVYVPTYFYESKERKARKNAVDIHIAIEAIEVMFTQPHINTFILLTGDKDFIPLANALRRHGKSVIAVGVQGTTSPYMRQATDDFVFYHQLLIENKGKKPELLEKDIYQVLVDAVKKLQSENQKTVFPQVKHTMTEMLGSFNEKEYTDRKGVNFNRFKDFVLEAQRLGHVHLLTTGSVNEVLLPGDISRDEDQKEQVSAESDSSVTAEVRDTESAFDLLVWAVNHASEKGKSPRTSSIKTIMRSAESDFDEKKLVNDSGEYFSKFSDFTRVAANRGLVRIEGKGIRMEVLPSHEPSTNSESQSDSGEGSDFDRTQPTLDVDALNTDNQISPDADPLPEGNSDDSEGDLPQEDQNLDDLEKPQDDKSGSQQQPLSYVSDYRMRVLVVDALRNCEYPAPAHLIGKRCIETSELRNVTLPNRRLNQLLTSAKNMGLLQESALEASDIQEYVFVEDPQKIKQFLEDES